MENKDLLTPDETAQLLNVTPGTLAVWRSRKSQALDYVKVGQKVMYRRADIERFIDLRRVAGTGE